MHETHTPTTVIILQKDIRPQQIFSKLLAGVTEPVVRDGRWYLSDDMVKVRDWCIKHGLDYSFDYFREKHLPFLEENMLGLRGDVPIEDFPLPYITLEKLT